MTTMFIIITRYSYVVDTQYVDSYDTSFLLFVVIVLLITAFFCQTHLNV